MGAIEYAFKQNIELYTCDLRQPEERAKFSFKLFQMLPVFKGIIIDSNKALVPMIQLIIHIPDRRITKSSQEIQVPALGVVLVEKIWAFNQSNRTKS